VIAVIDAGNTRLKWGLRDGDVWRARGALSHVELPQLPALLGEWSGVGELLACSVAGAAVEAAITSAAAAAGLPLQWFRSTAACAGVRNGYARPEQLGADRWAALVGAWGLLGTSCLVVSAGTATTVDLLLAEGDGARFAGGVILPGFELMRDALARNTARLPQAAGAFAPQPDNTDDAIVSGCLHAQAGAIERLYRQLPAAAPCLLAGGGAERLQPLLALPVQRVDDLVLLGLTRAAALRSAAGG